MINNVFRLGLILFAANLGSLSFAASIEGVTQEGDSHHSEFRYLNRNPGLLSPKLHRAQPILGGSLNPALTALLKKLGKTNPTIPQIAIQQAFLYFQNHPENAQNRDYVTIINFKQPSTQKRMYIIDMRAQTVEALYTAHGENSGELYATQFSNTNNSHQSSLGIYITGEEYQGDHGRTLYLFGMESTNSNVYARSIVLHGADYVSEDFINKNGRLGRSWGCPAVEMQYVDRVVRQLEGGSVINAYYSK